MMATHNTGRQRRTKRFLLFACAFALLFIVTLGPIVSNVSTA
jgi:uncharacterized protein Veg